MSRQLCKELDGDLTIKNDANDVCAFVLKVAVTNLDEDPAMTNEPRQSETKLILVSKD